MDVLPCARARNPRTHVRAQGGRHSLASLARGAQVPSDAPPQDANQPTQARCALARSARSGAPDSLQKPTTSNQPTQPSKMCPRSLRSLGCPPFPPMPPCYALPLGRAGFGLRPRPLLPRCWLVSVACCLRAPSRSRFGRFVAALRSRSVLNS